MPAKHLKKTAKAGPRNNHTKQMRTLPYEYAGRAGHGAAGSGMSASSGRQKRVTIADIARRAGVSPTTVSITLTDRRDIAIPEETRDTVRRCAYELGYFPSRLGEGFFRGRSRLIGVLAVAESYRPFLDCMAGIQEELARVDYIPLPMSANWLDGHAKGGFAPTWQCVEELPCLSRLLEYQVEGIIYFSRETSHAGACIDELCRRNIPMVILGGVAPQVDGVDIVGGDNEAVGRLAADHLLSVGCSSFACGMPALSHSLEEAVYSSFAARLGAAGYACDRLIVDVNDLGDMASLLSWRLKPPAGFFAVHDYMAALILRTALSLGWCIPGDLAVAGMGQTTLSEFNALPITSVDRNSMDSGKAAAKLLIQRIEGLTGQPQRILIPPSLHIHSSSVSDASWQLSTVAA